MADRSKRYDNPVHPDKQGGGKKNPSVDDKGDAEETAKKTAGNPPSADKPDDAIHKPDAGPEPGKGPAFGQVAERHGREHSDMEKRHQMEAGDMMERHKKERTDMHKRHGKEISETWQSEVREPEEGGAPKEVPSGEGPKLGKAEPQSDKGEALKGGDNPPKLGKTEDKGKGGTE